MDGLVGGAQRPGLAVLAPLALLPVLLVTGCSGDEEPPSSAPLEVVVESSKVDDDCVLNRDSVGAGTHDVTVIGEGGPATVRILTEAGVVVFEGGAITGGVGPTGGSPSVALSEGPHLVECTPDGGSPTTVPLQVDP